MKKQNKFSRFYLLLIFVLTVIPSVKAVSYTFDSVKEFIETKGIKSSDEVTLRNMTVAEVRYGGNNYLLMDSNGDVIRLYTSRGVYKKGDFIPSIKGLRDNSDSDTDLYFLEKYEQEEIGVADKSNRLNPLPHILTGKSDDMNENYSYVRIEGQIGGMGYRGATGTDYKGYDVTFDDDDSQYIVYHLTFSTLLKDNVIELNQKYVINGMIDNTIFSNRSVSDKQKKVIYMFSFWSVDDAENHKWNIGVYSANEDEGECYVSDDAAAKDNEGIVWETVSDGQTVTIHAQPKKGYEFKCWVLNGKEISDEPSLSFTAIGDVIYRAEFEESESIVEVKTVEIILPTSDMGSIKINDEVISESKSMEIEDNQEIKIEAVPNEGYEFDYWDLGDGTIIKENPYLLTVTENVSIKAYFKESIKTANISVSVNNPDEGMFRVNNGLTTNESQVKELQEGESVIVEAIPALGYEFSHWMVNGEEQILDNPFTFAVEDDMTLVAFFKKQEWTISFKAGGNGNMKVQTADEVELSTGDKVSHGTEIIVTLIPDNRYIVDQLYVKRGEDDGANVPVVENKYSTVVKSDMIINATFKADINGYYDLKVSVEEKDGEILGKAYIDEPGTTSVSAKYMDNHTFYAIPSDYCKFVGWRNAEDDYIRTVGKKQNDAYVLEWNGNCDENLVAVFDYIMEFPRTVTVKVNSQTKGSAMIEGETETSIQTRKPVKVIAKPLTEYDYFENWTDANNVIISLEPEFIYEGEEDIELTANFYSKYPVKLTNVGKSESHLEDEEGNLIDNDSVVLENTLIKLLGSCDETEELQQIIINNSPVSGQVDDGILDMAIVVKEPLTIKVLWQPRQYNLTVSSSIGGTVNLYGEITEAGTPTGNKFDPLQKISHGTVIHIFPIAEDGYELESLIINGKDRISDLQKDYISHIAESHVSIEANFKAKPSGVMDNFTDESQKDIQIYDLRGIKINRQIDELAPGIYIIKQGDKVKKIKVN
ncbi:MAG: hypothetical protein J1E38_08520 [Paramuribaculum sp.]|nr:hypothetical protein [Paramuribaculum sp.]